MTARVIKTIRCAIYTRKSSEHGLELEFNSLDAQREACEAYVKSQAHEGWRALPARYEDAAFSAGTLERPALQRLLKDIDAGKVDVIVVYKIDRLTRSLADFAKLVEIFDAKSISFVAITQQFNTTTSMGRLTLNVLLSFAQFERELSSERVRDKVAASRRKGKWTGGSVPMGYDAKDKKLIVNEAEAKHVRTIFKRYLELGTIKLLQDDIRIKKIHSKRRTNLKGRVSGGVPWTYGSLAHLLLNRIYIGEIGHKGDWFPAEHEPIVDRSVFDQVQQRLNSNRVDRKLQRTESGALLAGRLFDDRGNRMSPSFSTKRGVRYFFYVSSALLRGHKDKAGSIGRVSAPELEATVVKAARAYVQHFKPDMDARSLVRSHVARVMVLKDQVRIEFERSVNADKSEADEFSEALGEPAPNHVLLPWSPVSTRPLMKIDELATSSSAKPNPVLVQALARAHSWVQQLSDGTYATIEELAAKNNIHPKVVRKAIRLAFLAPQIISIIFNGEQPQSVTLAILQDASVLSWAKQQRSMSLE
jgi:DNA invertase Pin-like site-specific DNA recombinase